MNPAKIIHLTSAHPPFDTRIFYKECVSLARAGYEVVLIAPHDRSETVQGVRIRAVPRPSSKGQRVKQTIRQVYRAALKEDGALYHFHDPELIPAGMLLKLHGKKVVVDVHENLPAQILGKEYIRLHWTRRFLALIASLSEKAAYSMYDGTVVANPLATERFSGEKTIVLANYPILSLIDDLSPADVGNNDHSILIYVGGLRKVRGICELVKAMPSLNDSVELWLAGPWVSDEFRAECESLPGWKNVRYLGYLLPSEVYRFLKKANIGLVTLLPQENYLTNLPVKAFEYMACSLPMVMSDFPYWQDVFEDAAIFVDPQDAIVVADAIQHLLDHPEEAQQMGATGRRLVEEHYSWETEEPKLLALYEQILGK